MAVVMTPHTHAHLRDTEGQLADKANHAKRAHIVPGICEWNAPWVTASCCGYVCLLIVEEFGILDTLGRRERYGEKDTYYYYSTETYIESQYILFVLKT